ncbi:MAG: sigma factor-like helix-turn-helix DNA-binding protein, partial [Cyanobacteria bacterium P01_F01_bin.53]
ELSNCIEPFIKALPKKSALLLEEIDLKGKSQKEYAQSQGISYSTLKSRVQKSRAELRELFEECCVFSKDGNGNIKDFEAKSGKCKGC